MNSNFNVLDPNQDICGNFLIEASAGTGKTFTIAHLVARFILEPKHDMAFQKMAIITFTRASASELKKRIKDLFLELKSKLEHEEKTFLDPFHIDKKHLLLKIDLAIETLEEALIQTIHGFSFYLLKKFALELDLFIPQESEESEHLDDLAYDLIADHLKSDKIKEYLSPSQIQALLGSMRGNLNHLIISLRQKILSDIEIKTPTTFSDDLNDLKAVCETLDSFPNWDQLQDTVFKFKYATLTKEEVADQLKAFSEKNYQLISTFKTCFLSFLDEKHLKKNQVIDPVCPAIGWLYQLKAKALPIIESIFNVGKIELLISSFLKKELSTLLKEKNLLSFSSILKELQIQSSDSIKAQLLKNHLDCVIIDEFQDTDDTQWKILQNLFIKQPVKALYMVGDPKQAIYAFRAADVYTYILAKEKTPHLKIGCLDVCFRSDPKLILGLNHFFSSTPWIELPFYQKAFPFHPVKAAKTFGIDDQPFVFYDLKMNPDLLEEQIANLALHLALSYPSDKIAILVKDRFQMDRIESFLKKKNLNFSSFKNENLVDSIPYKLIKTFLNVLNTSCDPSSLNAFLISSFCNLTWNECIDKTQALSSCFKPILESFLTSGLLASFQQLLRIKAPFLSQSFHEKLICLHGQELLEKMYFVLQLLENNVLPNADPLLYLVEIEKLVKENTLLPQTRNLFSQIELLTTHMSKGLEFDHVIALGTSTRNGTSFKTILKKTETSLILDLLDNSPSSILALHELDAEKLRQLYVALTRAKKTLHIPLIDYSNEQVRLGSLSPLEYFLLKSTNPSLDFLTLYHQTIDFSKALQNLINHPQITCKDTIPIEPSFGFHRLYATIDPEIKYLKPKQHMLSSFSSLKTTTPFFHAVENTSILKGKEYGDFFHKLVEEMIRRNLYSKISSDDIKNWVFTWIQGSVFEDEKENIYAHLLFAFTVKLQTVDGKISLDQIPFEHLLIEQDFLMQDEELSIKGFIDLIFIYQNKLYFIDWKTSQLNGENETDVQAYMESSSYLLQLQIYKKALLKRKDFFSIPYANAYFIFVKHGVVYQENKEVTCIG